MVLNRFASWAGNAVFAACRANDHKVTGMESALTESVR